MTHRGKVLTAVDDLPNFRDLPRRPEFSSALLVEPSHFSVDYRINPYMVDDVDHSRATDQWNTLADVYRDLGDVAVLDPDEIRQEMGSDRAPSPDELPDMVFCSNHALPTPDGRGFILAQMGCEERVGEEAYFSKWAESAGYTVERLSTPAVFEGNGDAKWHPNRELLWGGYGQRTQIEVYEEIADRLGVTVVPIELTDEAYYHLDVCLSPLDEATALACPDAFTEKGMAKLTGVFETVIEVPAEEAQGGLACNCHSVDGHHVVIEAGNPVTVDRLRANGYRPIKVATDEFIKAGGSVSCLTLPHR